jgi:hypothetical protein
MFPGSSLGRMGTSDLVCSGIRWYLTEISVEVLYNGHISFHIVPKPFCRSVTLYKPFS